MAHGKQDKKLEPMNRPGPALADYQRMSNAEIAAVVREKLREAGGNTFDLVEVDVQGRRVFLRGEVPGEAAEQLAARIVSDEIGLEVIDELRVTQTLWKQGEDEPRHGIETGSDSDVGKRRLAGHRETTADVFEAEEEGLTFTPPTRPVPDDER